MVATSQMFFMAINYKADVTCMTFRYKSETLSTLRFAQRAKEIKNKVVVNETTDDDVNMLREQVRLLRVKSFLIIMLSCLKIK
jgi:hypothetical protein